MLAFSQTVQFALDLEGDALLVIIEAQHLEGHQSPAILRRSTVHLAIRSFANDGLEVERAQRVGVPNEALFPLCGHEAAGWRLARSSLLTFVPQWTDRRCAERAGEEGGGEEGAGEGDEEEEDEGEEE
eukprot:scaffold282354_cov36-Tisochrysis_lutea.AAC.1